MSNYLKARFPTPLLNTPDFDKIFRASKQVLNEKGLFYPLEMIALPGTKLIIENQLSPYIYKVKTKEYPHGSVYIDSRSTDQVNTETPERQRVLPSKEKILAHLESLLGLPYIWGGNYSEGALEFCSLYDTPWSLRGVDCSGLLYEATNGYTPRNTSQLIAFGEEVQSLHDVKPLDILIWPGHVIIIYDRATTIESLYGRGVILSSLSDRLSQISHQNFIIRRFIT